MKKLKVSVIGAGHLGAIHIKLLLQNPTVEVCGVYDLNSNNALEVSNSYNIININNLEEAIAVSDALFVITSTTGHFNVAKEILTQNKHVFIENIKRKKFHTKYRI